MGCDILKLYLLEEREQMVADMEQEAIMRYCEEHGFSMFCFETSFMTNDWNWHVQYPDMLYICAKTLSEARDFVLRAYYKSHEYDGDCGVLFRNTHTLYVGG